MTRLAQASGKTPSALFISGIIEQDKVPIGCGSFGDVFQGKMMDGNMVAVKRMRCYLRQTEEQRETNLKVGLSKLILSSRLIETTTKAMCKEALIWSHLEHPNLLPFCGIKRELLPFSLCLVSPWMEAGNIMDYLGSMRPDDRVGVLDRFVSLVCSVEI